MPDEKNTIKLDETDEDADWIKIARLRAGRGFDLEEQPKTVAEFARMTGMTTREARQLAVVKEAIRLKVLRAV